MSELWRLMVDDGAGAAEGLALDEAVMGSYRQDAPDRPPTLRLYSYRSHCALVGRFQNLAAEVDLAACQRTGTEVGRRPTGGGAIIMGSGQLGVAYVDRAPAGRPPRVIMEKFGAALAAGLAELGITATFEGKNDLEVGGRKIAGAGLYVDPDGALLFHASVLADLDVAFMLEVLRVPAAKLAGRAVTSVAERVTTVSAQVGSRHDAASVRPAIATGFTKVFGAQLRPGGPEAAEQARAMVLVTSRYRSPSWLGERSAVADGSGSALLKTPAGLATIYLSTHGDVVKGAMVAGDFNELPPELVALEAGLRWRRLDQRAVTAVVAGSGAAAALGVPAEQVVAAVLEAGRQARASARRGCGHRRRHRRRAGQKREHDGLVPAAAARPTAVRPSAVRPIAVRPSAVRAGGAGRGRCARHEPRVRAHLDGQRHRFAHALGPLQPAISKFGGINLLLNYEEGCRSDCAYCGLARARPGGHADKSFIRVQWPLVRTEDVAERVARFEPALTRICISMVTHGHAYRDTCTITAALAGRSKVPISVLVAPPVVNRRRLEDCGPPAST